MKICFNCKINKDETDFFKKAAAKDGLQPNCKICANKYYEKKGVVTKYIERNKKTRSRNKALLGEYKSRLCCTQCGETHPACLDFHHKDTNKFKDVADMAASTYKWENILNEIQKCIVLCANCHRKEHFINK